MSQQNKVLKFFEEKGFYIVLFLCVVAIGTAVYVLFLTPTLPSEDTVMSFDVPQDYYESEPVSGETDTFNFPKTTAVTSATTPQTSGQTTANNTTTAPATTKSTPKTTAKASDTATTKSDSEPAPKPTKSAPTFYVRPVNGEIHAHFSGDELVYDRTNGDWRTHNGVDFLCDNGEKVMAVADGEVKDIFTDEYYGTSVLVEHGDGIESIYLGLVTEATVFKGQKVSAGDCIGAVNSDVLFESSLPVHFHLEMTKDGERIDPLSLIDG